MSAAIDELKEMGGADFVQELVETFATTAQASLASLRGSDRAEGAKAAHSIAGSAGQLGASVLERVARAVERALRSNATVPEHEIAALEAEVARAIVALRAAARA